MQTSSQYSDRYIERMAEYAGLEVHAFEAWMDSLPASAARRFIVDFQSEAPLIAEYDAPREWRPWLGMLFPQFKSFGEHHAFYWDWLFKIRPNVRCRPLVNVWPRGHGKSSSGEAGLVYLGGEEIRHYAWYIQEVQDQADNTLSNIRAVLESERVEGFYPHLAHAQMTKYGQRKAWRRNRIVTANGFTIDAMGLDTARRGARSEDQRPDLLIFDDIDGKHDSAATTRRKIETITTSILPAGSVDAVGLYLQNMIIPNGVVAQLVDGRADFLLDRIINGPIPAVEDLEYMQDEYEDGRRYWRITTGEPTWDGMDLRACEAKMNEWGLTAFLQEAQHDVNHSPGGIFSHLFYRHIAESEVPPLLEIQVWGDPAVTATGDCMGIQADGIDEDGLIYRLYSWENNTSPDDVIRRMIRKAVELWQRHQCMISIGLETNQGGDTWESLYYRIWDEMLADPNEPVTINTPRPRYLWAKATTATGGKTARAYEMLVDYERDLIIHVLGTHRVLEAALFRVYKTKPFDLADAAYWSWKHLRMLIGGETEEYKQIAEPVRVSTW